VKWTKTYKIIQDYFIYSGDVTRLKRFLSPILAMKTLLRA